MSSGRALLNERSAGPDLDEPDMNRATPLKRAHALQVVRPTLADSFSETPSLRSASLAIVSKLLESSSLGEILARIQLLMNDAGTVARSVDAPEVVETENLRIEKYAHRVLVSSREVTLTNLEFRLLVTLADRRDHVHTRASLLIDVWGLHPGSRTRTVDTHVRRLRSKLGSAGALIQTVHGVGYRFSDRGSNQRLDGRCRPARGMPPSHSANRVSRVR